MASKAKKSLEQFVAGLELDLRSISLDQIEFNEENPNEMPPDVYEALKADIRDHGFWQPVLVTPLPDGRFRMVDGEHRARIVGELGGTAIPAVVGGEWDLTEQRYRLLTMNRFKGDFAPVPLADMLVTLRESETDAAIRQRLGMDEAELRGKIELATFGDELLERAAEELEQERANAPMALRFVVKPRDGELIERVVATAQTGKMDRGQALAAVCREWERTHKPKEKK